MKKIIMIAGLVILSSCGKKESNGNNDSNVSDFAVENGSTPNCDDQDVLETVISLVKENERNEVNGQRISLDSLKIEITGILTKAKDDELKSCNCEGTANGFNYKGEPYVSGNVTYFIQQNSKGETMVQLNQSGPFN